MNRCMPFVFHPIQVAMLLFRYAELPTAALVKGVTVALLHDLLEDTNTSPWTLRVLFGGTVLEAVEAMTKDETIPTHGVSKMPVVRDKVARIQATGWTWLGLVEIADRLANLLDVPPAWSNAKLHAYLDEAEYMERSLCVLENDLCMRLRVRINDMRRQYNASTMQ
jgi:guanosine-3',5'-bis(diphosphate) 3'-pyrophosphohydrolase